MLARRVSTLLLAFLAMAGNLAAADAIVFGPKTFTVAAKAHQQFDETLSLNGPCDTPFAVYTLTATQGTTPVKAAKISLNDAILVDAKNFEGTIEQTIFVRPTNLLRIEIDGGTADGSLSVSVRRRIELIAPVLAEKAYSLAASKSERFTESFAVADTAGPFALILRNGTASLLPVDDARVVLNGTEILTKKDIESRGNQDIPQIFTRDISLRPQNTLELELKSNKTPAGVTLQIVRRIADTQGPRIQLDALLDGQTVTSSPLAITGKATDDSGMSSLSINGTAVPLDAAGMFRHSVTLTPGANVLTFAATDCQGNATERRITALFANDTTPPVLEVTLPPADGERFLTTSNGTRQATILGTVQDADSGVRTVTCNGAPATVQSGLYDCTVTLGAAGANDVEVVATDNAGNRAQARRQILLVIDDVAPTIGVIAPPTSAAGWTSGSILSFECSDNVSVAICPFDEYLNDGANQRFERAASDPAGNVTRVEVTLNVDAVPPSVNVDDTPMLTGNGQFRLTGDVTDATSGIATLRCGAVMATVTGERFECVVPLAPDFQTIEIVATDRADNTTTASRSIELDQTPPELTITQPESASFDTNASSVVVSGTAGDRHGVASVTIGGASIDLDGNGFASEVPLSEGVNHIEIRAVDRAGNATVRTIDVRFLPRAELSITSPADLAVLRSSTVDVIGTIAGSALASLRVNGIAATISGTTFTAANVPLWQGRTVITAIGTTAGGQIATASVNVYRDSIPPRVIVEWPPADSDLGVSPAIVSGTVDDIVVGTINAGQVEVTVNGAPALVSNRTFKASVTLTPGPNTLIIQATDQGGNTTTTAHDVRLAAPVAERILPIGGDDQTATIGTQLPASLRVRVVDASGAPITNRSVTFSVVQNNGTLAANGVSDRRVTVVTDAQGEASARWILGTRAGVANQQVNVTSGDAASARFVASGTTGAPALIVVDMGSNQFGIDGERLPRPLVVAVVDRGSNRVADVPVTFSVVEGGGSIDGQSSVVVRTDSDGRAWITPTLGPRSGYDNHQFRASIAGVESVAVFHASSAPAGPPIETKISGVVLDNTNLPIAGVTMRIEGTSIQTHTDTNGRFVFTGAPVGYVRLIADGSTVERAGTWPTLEFAMYTNSGQDNTVGMPIYLLPIDVTRGIQVDEQRGGTITLPELLGFSLTIAPGSATFPGGLRTGTVSVTLVHNDKMPMVPGFGQQPRFLVTIQPPGAHFDPPAALTMPNTDGLAPGEVTELYSFDHDLGQFVAIGTGSVSEDGSIVRSDAGVGIIKAGWHGGGNPAGSGTTGTIHVDVTVDEDRGTPPPSARKRIASQSARHPIVTLTTDEPAVALPNTCFLVTARGNPDGSVPPTGPSSYAWKVEGDAELLTAPKCTGASECVARVKAKDPGEIKVSVTYTASNGQSKTETAKIDCRELKVEIVALSFLDSLPIYKDLVHDQREDPREPIPLIKDPEWKKKDDGSGLEKDDAAAYQGNFVADRERKISLRAVLKISPAAKREYTGLVLEGVIDNVPDARVRKTITIKKGDQWIEETLANENLEFLLPKTTYFYDPLKITWSILPENGCADDKSRIEAGVTETKLYVTLAEPATKLYQTILHLATSGTPAASVQGAIEKTWAKFTSKNVQSWDKTRSFVYYKKDIPLNEIVLKEDDFELFLKGATRGGGRCGMHNRLLSRAFLVNRVPHATISVRPIDQPKDDGLCAAENIRAGTCSSGFFVKNWTFGEEKLTGFGPYRWRWITSGPGIAMVPPPSDSQPNVYGEMINREDGIAGQNSPNPSQKVFKDHAIVEIVPGGAVTGLFFTRYTLGNVPIDRVEDVTIDLALAPIVLVFTPDQGEKRVTKVSIRINGSEIINANNPTTAIKGTIPVRLLVNGMNRIGIEVSGPEGATATLSIAGQNFSFNGSKYYDPSYGVTYGKPLDFETNSLDGYYVVLPNWAATIKGARMPQKDQTGVSFGGPPNEEDRP